MWGDPRRMCFSALLGTLSAHMGTLSAHTGTLSAHVCFRPSAGKELPWPYDHLIEMPHKCLMEMLFDNAALQVGLPVPLKNILTSTLNSLISTLNSIISALDCIFRTLPSITGTSNGVIFSTALPALGRRS